MGSSTTPGPKHFWEKGSTPRPPVRDIISGYETTTNPEAGVGGPGSRYNPTTQTPRMKRGGSVLTPRGAATMAKLHKRHGETI